MAKRNHTPAEPGNVPLKTIRTTFARLRKLRTQTRAILAELRTIAQGWPEVDENDEQADLRLQIEGATDAFWEALDLLTPIPDVHRDFSLIEHPAKEVSHA